MASSIFDRDLADGPANFVPLSPLSFLQRAAHVWPTKTAVIHGPTRFDYRTLDQRARRLASALSRRGIGLGDTVAVMAPNTPPLLEAHYGVPMLGAVLNALNTRLDAAAIAFILEHSEAKILIVDREYATGVRGALGQMKSPPPVIEIDDPLMEGGERGFGEQDYDAFLASGDPAFAWTPPEREWQAIALNYTSGTTGNPKGVVFQHRGAYLNSLGNVIAFGVNDRSVYLWTLPMFHCNGWSYTWAVTAAGGTHVCLRRVAPGPIFQAIVEHGVTHLCAAPTILSMLIHAPNSEKRAFKHTVEIATGGAAPPSAVIAGMERLGFRVTHLYGLTECFGPATICQWQDDWAALDLDAKAAKMARQGVGHPTLEAVMVAHPETMAPVPADGTTIGEIMLRSNTVMKGYLKNPAATAEAFRGGWFHTGDLGVLHPDGYVEVKDRMKDVIISGGENISSLELEELIYKHPAVMEAAVVARPDEKWGETPCAFVTLKPGEALDAPMLIAWTRDRIAHFKAPKTVIFGPLPKTATGKIQKFVLRDRAKAL
ncbi:MAG: acyl-CoA synthetase [Alphaproteobacteria bacterium]|nr:acyl-CoA synthetase [Alphaproteobacteria bacterium]